jgi:hypothetical protein
VPPVKPAQELREEGWKSEEGGQAAVKANRFQSAQDFVW